MAEGRFEEAIKILKSGAKCNDRTLPSDDELLEMMQAIKEDVSILSKDVLDTFLIILFCLDRKRIRKWKRREF